MSIYIIPRLIALICLMMVSINSADAFLLSGSYTSSAPPSQTITGVTVAGGSTVSYISGISSSASIGAIAVQETGGTFSGTIALGGTNAADFSLSATSLPANLNANGSTPTCTSTTNYSITITPTQTGVINSGTAYPITVTCNPDPTTNILTADRDAYPNWKMAGLQSVGGIPALGTQCGSTVSPIGGGSDDTTDIQNAINACTAGDYVQLASGAGAASYSGYISGTTLTVTSSVTGTIAASQVVQLSGSPFSGVVPGTTIISGSGTSWTVSYSQTVGNAAAPVNFANVTPFTIAEGHSVNVNKGIVLNGAGPGLTIVQHPPGQDTTNDVCNSPGAWGATLNSDCPGNSASTPIILGGTGTIAATTALTSNAAQGATSVVVSSATGISAGSLVLVDELANGQPMPDCCFNNGMSFTGSISGTTLTASAVAACGSVCSTIVPGAQLTATSTPLTANTTVSSQLTTTATFTGCIGATSACTTAGTNLYVTAVSSGVSMVPGAKITGTGVTSNTTLGFQSSGTTGGIGTYAVSTSQQVASETMNTTGSTGTYTVSQSQNVSSETMTPTGAVWAAPDYTFEWNAHNPPINFFDSSTYDNTFTSGDACDYSIRCGGVVEELHLVTSVVGDTITFDSPLTLPYTTANSAEVHAYTNSTSNIVQNAGIENMTVEYGDQGNVLFEACVYCYAKNVESTIWLNGGGFAFYGGAFRDQLDTFYSHYAAWPVNGGGGYSINLTYGTSEGYAVNGISMEANKVEVARASGSGWVFAYDYMDDSYINGNSSWIETGLNCSHLIGSHDCLFEGDESDNSDNDTTHGSSGHMTFFRTWLKGFRQPFIGLDGTERDDSTACCGVQRAAGDHDLTYWDSFVGDVVGFPSLVSTWNYRCVGGPAGSGCNPSVYLIGWEDANLAGVEGDATQSLTYPTSPTSSNQTATGPGCTSTGTDCVPILTGNYDYQTNAQHFDSRGSVTIPNSFYLASEPSFFSSVSCTWPWVNPVAGTTSFLPAKMRFDAGTPFTAVTCGASPTNSIAANPTSIVSGGTTYLSWNSTNATGCTGTNFSTGSLAPRSSLGLAEQPSSTTTYTITCGSATPASVTVTVTGGGTNSTWNPSNVSSQWTLSNGNLTATNNTGGSDQIGANTVAHSSGLLYAEFKCSTATANIGVGIWSGTSGNYNTYLGDGTKTSFGFFSNGQYGWNGSPVSGAWSGCVTGDTVGMEVNFSTSTAYARTYHSGTWGSFSSGNSFSGIGGTSWYLAGDTKTLNDAEEICDNTTSCGIGPLPSGYSWWQ